MKNITKKLLIDSFHSFSYEMNRGRQLNKPIRAIELKIGEMVEDIHGLLWNKIEDWQNEII
mgnify:CR=1 FL=1